VVWLSLAGVRERSSVLEQNQELRGQVLQRGRTRCVGPDESCKPETLKIKRLPA
jgi:hypothetical protein